MKKHASILTVIFISTVLVLLWGRTYIGVKFLMGMIFLLLLVLFAMGVTWLLYRKEWRQVLGLKTKGINAKIIWKSFAVGLLINLICGIVVNIVYYLIFKEMPLNPLGEFGNTLIILPLALIWAPLTEELLFRGFIQGLWQRLYSNQEKMPTKRIIVITALLFAISHFGFLFNISVKQFLFNACSIFIVALYMGWLRYKYQSIIPSMFAHFGCNSAMVVAPIIGLVFAVGFSGSFSEMHRQQEVLPYINDTIPYNFDPNDMDEWQKSYKKFVILERPRSEEAVKHLKGISTNIYVFFTIDTCGNVYNVHAPDSAYYIKEYGYNYAEDAINVIKSLPQCKPYITNGKKVEKEMSVSVPLYPY